MREGRLAKAALRVSGIRVLAGKLKLATDMLCDDVKRAVYSFLDGSLDEHTQIDYTAHIRLCPHCDTRTKVQQRLRIFIVRRLRPESAPERLKQRLLRTFRAIKAEWA